MNWIDQIVTAADRFQSRRRCTAVPVAVWKKFQDDQAGNLAALICYFGFLAIFPLLLILATVLDMTLKSNPGLHKDLLNSALAQYPVIGNEISNSLGSLSGSGFPLTVGILVLLLGTRGVAFAMQNALCTVWEIPRERRPGFPWSWLYGMGLVLVVGVGLVVTSFLSGIAGGAGHVLIGFIEHVGAVSVSLVANVGVFWLAFRLATLRTVRWRDLRRGAVLAAVVWQVLQVTGGYVITHYLHRASSLYGTFGVVLGLLGWLYLQATVTLYCAEVDVVLVKGRWPRAVRAVAADAAPVSSAVAEGSAPSSSAAPSSGPAVVPGPRPGAAGTGTEEATNRRPTREEAGHDTPAA